MGHGSWHCDRKRRKKLKAITFDAGSTPDLVPTVPSLLQLPKGPAE